MKRNMVRISLALVLILSLCLSIASPAIAAKPEEPKSNKPLAWVTWAGSNGKAKDEMPQGHMVTKFHVKMLSNGSLVGDMHIDYLDGGFTDERYTDEYEIKKAYFTEEGGHNVAYILVTVVDEFDLTWTMCWRFEDGGEPALANDWVRNYLYYPANITDIESVPWPELGAIPLPGWPPGEPGWYNWFGPSSTRSNVQVKITDAYFD